jgi:hypothetical protein
MFNYTAVKNAKNEVVQATMKYDTATNDYMTALQGRGSTRAAKAVLHRAEDRLIALQNRLHEVCGHDMELITLIAREIDEEVTAFGGHRVRPQVVK